MSCYQELTVRCKKESSIYFQLRSNLPYSLEVDENAENATLSPPWQKEYYNSCAY